MCPSCVAWPSSWAWAHKTYLDTVPGLTPRTIHLPQPHPFPMPEKKDSPLTNRDPTFRSWVTKAEANVNPLGSPHVPVHPTPPPYASMHPVPYHPAPCVPPHHSLTPLGCPKCPPWGIDCPLHLVDHETTTFVYPASFHPSARPILSCPQPCKIGRYLFLRPVPFHRTSTHVVRGVKEKRKGDKEK